LIYNSLTVISIPPVFSNENHTIIQSSFLHHLTLFVEKSLLCKPLLESALNSDDVNSQFGGFGGCDHFETGTNP